MAGSLLSLGNLQDSLFHLARTTAAACQASESIRGSSLCNRFFAVCAPIESESPFHDISSTFPCHNLISTPSQEQQEQQQHLPRSQELGEIGSQETGIKSQHWRYLHLLLRPSYASIYGGPRTCRRRLWIQLSLPSCQPIHAPLRKSMALRSSHQQQHQEVINSQARLDL